MGYKINFGNDVIVLPKTTVLAKLKDAGEIETKVLIYLLSDENLLNDSESGAKELANVLGCERVDIDSAIAFWRGAGVITLFEGKSDKRKSQKHPEVPSYSGEELSNVIDNLGLQEIIDECQRICGKIFNTNEINKIAALSDYLGLDGEFILLLFTYCKSKGKLSIRYIEKTAYELYDQGVDTLPKLEAYIKRGEEIASLEGKLRKLFGIGSRSLTPKEKKYFTVWNEEWGFDFDIIEKAYSVTIDKTDKLSLPYLNKVLSNWNNSGFRTVEEIDASIESYNQKKQEEEQVKKGSFDTDEFFELALKRSYESIKKQ